MPSTIPPTRENLPRGRATPAEVTVIDWPVRDQPVGASFALALAAAAAWLSVWATGNPLVGIVVAVLLAATLWRTWLPVRFTLGSSGIDQKLLGLSWRFTWSSIHHYQVRSDGVVLLFDAQIAPLSPLRGLYLRWGPHREGVMANLDFYLPGCGVTC